MMKIRKYLGPKLVSVQCRVSLFMRSTQEDSIGFFDHMRSGCEHSSSFKSVNMQNKHGSSIYMIAQLLSEEVY